MDCSRTGKWQKTGIGESSKWQKGVASHGDAFSTPNLWNFQTWVAWAPTCWRSKLYWLVVYLPLWKIWRSVGMMTFPIYGNIKFMFQTTNQWLYYCENRGTRISGQIIIIHWAAPAHWNVGPCRGWFPYKNHDSSEGEQWGRYNLPR